MTDEAEIEEMNVRGRAVQIHFDRKGSQRIVRVAHPGRLTHDDIALVNKHLVDKVIFDLTGCSCLSGTIDVIWEKGFDRVINLQLGAAAPMR
ncbi:MAG: hypothetical protein ACK4MX_07280 [Thermaurantiacus sp.]